MAYSPPANVHDCFFVWTVQIRQLILLSCLSILVDQRADCLPCRKVLILFDFVEPQEQHLSPLCRDECEFESFSPPNKVKGGKDPEKRKVREAIFFFEGGIWGA